MVESRPFISQESVKGALDHLLYSSSTHELNPLTNLLLVDYFLANPDFPRTTLDRDIAVKHILAEIIRNELFDQRTFLGRENPVNVETLDEASKHIREDAIDQNPELIGWSLLFYRYIRVELNISMELYGRFGYVEERSLRRYQLHSTKRLTEKLIQREWEVRQFYRQLRLQTTLPSIMPVTLFGRDDVFEVIDKLFEENPLRHFQITGIAGIGKTALVQEFMRMHIQAELVDEIVWLNRPNSVQHIRYQIEDQLSAGQTRFDLRQYSLMNRLYVIIDGADSLDPNDLTELLLDLSGACVILTARQPILVNSRIHHVSLSELADKDAVEMIRFLADAQHDITDNYAAYIWQSLGGNPLVIKLAINNLSLKHPDFLDVTPLDEVFDQTFSMLPQSLRVAWIICALYPLGDIDISQLIILWSEFIKLSTIDALLKRKLLEQGKNPAYCRMVLSARHYLENSVKHRGEIDKIINAALDYLSKHDSDVGNDTYELMEHILVSEWPILEQSREYVWIKSLVGMGISKGRNLVWLQIFESYTDRLNDPELCFHYATVLRYLSMWEKAQQLFEQVIITYGEQGDFVRQGRALMELGCLFRQKGAYLDSLRVFAKVEKVADQYQDTALENDVRLEIAQIILDQGDLILFNAITGHLPRTMRLLSMQISASLIEGDLDKGLEIAKNILSEYQPNSIHAGRIYGTMGRICEQKRDYDRAAQYLGQAITILEQERDRYALARVQSNLAAVLTNLKLYDEAYQLLETAKEVQQRLGDRAGLAATQHNLNILNQIISIH